MDRAISDGICQPCLIFGCLVVFTADVAGDVRVVSQLRHQSVSTTNRPTEVAVHCQPFYKGPFRPKNATHNADSGDETHPVR